AFMAGLAAFQALLWHCVRQDRIAVGSPIANRNRSELEGLIGFFVNTLVLAADFSRDPSWRELLDQVRETTLGAYAHQDLPFEKLVEELQPERAGNLNPLFQVMFSMDTAAAPAAAVARPDPGAPAAALSAVAAKFDLNLHLADVGGGWQGVLEYDRDLFDAATIVRLAAHFHTLLAAFAGGPDRRLSDLSPLSAAERHLAAEWNDTCCVFFRVA